MKVKVILDRFPYRFAECGTLEINGMPDYRILKYNEITKTYYTMYKLDNSIQLDYCIEDPEYTNWLDPDPEVAAYGGRRDVVVSPYQGA